MQKIQNFGQKVGDEIIVKVANVDDLGRVNLTQKGIIFDDEDRERRRDRRE